jgi:hypothetical protein
VYYKKSAYFIGEVCAYRYLINIDGIEVRGCDTPGRFATAELLDIFTEPVILKETKRR